LSNLNLNKNGAAGSWSLSNYGPRMLKRDFNPGFMVEHFVKDLEIALEECSKMGIGWRKKILNLSVARIEFGKDVL
jgi:3-hydroxyisobutyrate dehydrogenase-like beta-hydroxyacid dehydrogenase